MKAQCILCHAQFDYNSPDSDLHYVCNECLANPAWVRKQFYGKKPYYVGEDISTPDRAAEALKSQQQVVDNSLESFSRFLNVNISLYVDFVSIQLERERLRINNMANQSMATDTENPPPTDNAPAKEITEWSMTEYKIADKLTGMHTSCQRGVALDNKVILFLSNGVKPSDIVITVEEVEEGEERLGV